NDQQDSKLNHELAYDVQRSIHKVQDPKVLQEWAASDSPWLKQIAATELCLRNLRDKDTSKPKEKEMTSELDNRLFIDPS
ncbi:MAG: hypothetical protein WC838_07565, partial [Candidatus Margulisiibacteriota bacterium]